MRLPSPRRSLRGHLLPAALAGGQEALPLCALPPVAALAGPSSPCRLGRRLEALTMRVRLRAIPCPAALARVRSGAAAGRCAGPEGPPGPIRRPAGVCCRRRRGRPVAAPPSTARQAVPSGRVLRGGCTRAAVGAGGVCVAPPAALPAAPDASGIPQAPVAAEAARGRLTRPRTPSRTQRSRDAWWRHPCRRRPPGHAGEPRRRAVSCLGCPPDPGRVAG